MGQTTQSYLRAFPKARIWCFEPSSESFDALSQRFRSNPLVTCERLALGSHERIETLVCDTRSQTMNHLQAAVLPPATGFAADQTELVSVATLDSYCERSGIDTVDLLKVDTEGHDLEVLKGAMKLLEAEKIACVQCECSVNPDNGFHARFEDIKALLEDNNYRLFGIYEQTEEWFARLPILRRVNVMYISAAASNRNRGR